MGVGVSTLQKCLIGCSGVFRISKGENMVTEAVIAKGGAYVVTGGLFAELVIFHDSTYWYLGIMGAILSAFGVFHEIQTSMVEKEKNHTFFEVIAEVGKGLLLGFIAIPFWYLLLVSMGDSLIDVVATRAFGMEVVHDGRVDKSVWMLLSAILAWYTVPILNVLSEKASWLFNGGKKNA